MSLLNTISNKRLFDFPILYQKNKEYLKEHQWFSIDFSTGFFGLHKKQICRNILDPLISKTELILIYDLQTGNKKVQKFKSHLTQQHGRHILDMAGKKWEYFLPILYNPKVFSTIHEIRGSILLQCLNDNIPWKEIFKQCHGPYIVSNPSVGCGRVALNYAKRKFAHNNVFIIIDKINSGLESITITCGTDMIDGIYDTAVKACSLSKMRESEFEIIEKVEKRRGFSSQ